MYSVLDVELGYGIFSPPTTETKKLLHSDPQSPLSVNARLSFAASSNVADLLYPSDTVPRIKLEWRLTSDTVTVFESQYESELAGT